MRLWLLFVAAAAAGAADDDGVDSRTFFAAVDVDGSGALDAGELRRMQEALASQGVGEEGVAALDANGDGAVTAAEFEAGWLPLVMATAGAAEPDEFDPDDPALDQEIEVKRLDGTLSTMSVRDVLAAQKEQESALQTLNREDEASGTVSEEEMATTHPELSKAVNRARFAHRELVRQGHLGEGSELAGFSTLQAPRLPVELVERYGEERQYVMRLKLEGERSVDVSVVVDRDLFTAPHVALVAAWRVGRDEDNVVSRGPPLELELPPPPSLLERVRLLHVTWLVTGLALVVGGGCIAWGVHLLFFAESGSEGKRSEGEGRPEGEGKRSEGKKDR